MNKGLRWTLFSFVAIGWLLSVLLAATGYGIAIVDDDPDSAVGATFFVTVAYVLGWLGFLLVGPRPVQTWRDGDAGWAFAWWRAHFAMHAVWIAAMFLPAFAADGLDAVALYGVGGGLVAFAVVMTVIVHRMRSGKVGPAKQTRLAMEMSQQYSVTEAQQQVPDLQEEVTRLHRLQWLVFLPILIGVPIARAFARRGTLDATSASIIAGLVVICLALFMVVRFRLGARSRLLVALQLRILQGDSQADPGSGPGAQTPRPPAPVAAPQRDWTPPSVSMLVGCRTDRAGRPPVGRLVESGHEGRAFGTELMKVEWTDEDPKMIRLDLAWLQGQFAQGARNMQRVGLRDEPRLFLAYEEDF